MPEDKEREKLAKVIRQWNNNRLDLFEISQPDENLEFHGVMRFYLEDQVRGNVATKCLRVCSNSSTHEVIETLSEKFRPDMKMLTTSYSLYESHANKERKLDLDERPLFVQLSWTRDNTEGRFVLKKDEESLEDNCHEKKRGGMIQNFKRTLSRKEKKKTKANGKDSEDETGSTEKPLNNRVYVCTEGKRQEKQAVLGAKLAWSHYSDCSDQPGLPIEIKICDKSEEAFLTAVINYTNIATVHFKLSPAYILYAVARSALQRHCSPVTGQTHSVTQITNKMAAMTQKVIQRQQTIAGALAFWMANSSELLNFLKYDKDLSPLTQKSQMDLSHLVHNAYSCLLKSLQNELRMHLPTFSIDPEKHGPLPFGIEMVLNTLMNTMSLLRRCRVNPALTIQLFSQLFHFISAWLFNQLMSPEATPGLRSHYWGAALRQRLMAIEAWAERQGLELAADCHLGHIIQATTLLTMNKYSVKDAKDIQNTCFKLNSLQLHTLLGGYFYANNEPHIPPDLIDVVVAAAKASADNLICSEGRDIQLQESLDLCLPFLLPEGGYSCVTMRGIPAGFKEFLEPICQKGLCSLTCQPNLTGNWTAHFSEPASSSECLTAHKEPEVVTFTLSKPLNSGMGISIVAAKGAGQCNLGIYIKSIVKGGPAEMSGRLTAGDQLLSVDGQSLVGLSQERSAAVMMQTGPVVTLQVAKFGASYHGLGSLLSEPTLAQTTGDESHANSNSKAFVWHSMDPDPSEHLHGCSKRKKDQIMRRNRQLYRSNPSMTTGFDDEDEAVEPAVRGTNMATVSSVNLCANTFHREYLTLPTPKSQDKDLSESSRPQETLTLSLRPSDAPSCSKSSLMRQALSQENLCMDKRQNLWEQDQRAKQTMSHYSSFPIRSSVSAHDILSDNCSSTKQQQGSRPNGAGVWRTPLSQHSTVPPSTQPIRIDIPVTREVQTETNPPLTTFQRPSLLAVKMSQNLKVNGNAQSPQKQTHHIYACPIPATKNLPQPLLLSKQHRSGTCRDEAVKSQVVTSPTKHVSFQEPPTQQKQGLGPTKRKKPLQLSDPWRREAQEKLEKQQGLHVVELLEQEAQEPQVKAKCSAEDSNRLQRLSLEWQFQKRLQEIQKRGDNKDEEGDEALDMMLTIQQLEKKNMNKRSSAGNVKTVFKVLEKESGPNFSMKNYKSNTDQRPIKLRSQDINSITSSKRGGENQGKISSWKAPIQGASLVPSA